MSKPNDGGSAFPSFDDPDPKHETVAWTGMSLRDWFAGQALAGLIAGNSSWASLSTTHSNLSAVSDAVYRLADAMLEARQKAEK